MGRQAKFLCSLGHASQAVICHARHIIYCKITCGYSTCECASQLVCGQQNGKTPAIYLWFPQVDCIVRYHKKHGTRIRIRRWATHIQMWHSSQSIQCTSYFMVESWLNHHVDWRLLTALQNDAQRRTVQLSLTGCWDLAESVWKWCENLCVDGGAKKSMKSITEYSIAYIYVYLDGSRPAKFIQVAPPMWKFCFLSNGCKPSVSGCWVLRTSCLFLGSCCKKGLSRHLW